MPKRATAIKPEPTTTIKKKKRNTTKLVLPDSPLTLVINLKRRVDRLRKLRSVLREGGLTKWERIDAVDGAFLTWEEVSKYISVKALNDARTAEKLSIPTICRKTGSFSPHLSMGAVGCALSHRKAWERLASSKTRDWALILEDDVSRIADDIEDKLAQVIAVLPSSWQLCYVGYHESYGTLLLHGQRTRLAELGENESQTGLFGYLLRKSAAKELLANGDMFPLEHQVDVEMGMRRWRSMSRFALSPDAVLVHSPKSEEGEEDTDVQTISGKDDKKAHGKVPKGMLLL